MRLLLGSGLVGTRATRSPSSASAFAVVASSAVCWTCPATSLIDAVICDTAVAVMSVSPRCWRSSSSVWLASE